MMMATRRDIGMAALDRLIVRRFMHPHPAFAVKPARESRGETLGHMLRDHNRRRIFREQHQHRLQRLDAAGRGADGDELVDRAAAGRAESIAHRPLLRRRRLLQPRG